MTTKNFFILLMLPMGLFAQQPFLDAQLRLEPVWTRVADALGEPGSVESAEFSPNGKCIVSGTKFDYSVVMWRTSDGTELWRAYHPAGRPGTRHGRPQLDGTQIQRRLPGDRRP